MTTTSNHLSSTRRTLLGQLKRRLVTAGSATFAMLGWLSAEYSRAAAATRRYDELKRRGPPVPRPVEAASIQHTIFEEFYSGRAAIGWPP